MSLNKNCSCSSPQISLPPPKPDEWIRGGEHDPYADKKQSEQETRRTRLLAEDAQRQAYFEHKHKKEAKKSSAGAVRSDGSAEPLGNTGDCSQKTAGKNDREARNYYSCWYFKTKKTDEKTQQLEDFFTRYFKDRQSRQQLDVTPKIDPDSYNVLRFLQDKLREFGLGDKAIAKCLSGIIPTKKYAILEVMNQKVGYQGACMCRSSNCPVCSYFKEMEFAADLGNLAEKWLNKGSPNVIVPAVLTFSHTLYDDPKDVMRRFKLAFGKFLKHIKRWFKEDTGVSCEAYAYGIESTGSISNSWHHHINLVVLGQERVEDIGEKQDKREKIKLAILNVWNKCLDEVGLGRANRRNGVRVDIIRSVENIEKLAKYLAKNSLPAVLNFGLEMSSSRNKVGSVKGKVKRWTPFELLFDAYIHRDSDPARSKVHLELFLEYMDITHGLHMRQFSQDARKMLREIEEEGKESDNEEQIQDEENEKNERNIIGVISRNTLKSVRECRLFNESISLHKTELSPQQITNVLLNLERLDKFLKDEDVLGDHFNTISPQHYLSLVLAKEETDDLDHYLTRHTVGLCADYLMPYAEPIDFQHYIDNMELVDAEYQKEIAERDREASEQRAEMFENEAKGLINSFERHRRKYPKSLRKRFLTDSERKKISRELYYQDEVAIFELLLDNGVSVSKFMRWLPRADARNFNFDRLFDRYGKQYGDSAVLTALFHHWVVQPDLVIEAHYQKWEKLLCKPFDLRTKEQRKVDAEEIRQQRADRKEKEALEREERRKERAERKKKRELEKAAKQLIRQGKKLQKALDALLKQKERNSKKLRKIVDAMLKQKARKQRAELKKQKELEREEKRKQRAEKQRYT